MLQVRGPDHPDTLTALNNLAIVVCRLENEASLKEAAKQHAEVLRVRARFTWQVFAQSRSIDINTGAITGFSASGDCGAS